MKETDFARYLTQFLSAYLPGQRGTKRNTQLSYRDFVLRFLKWLEELRNCKTSTRNQRLAAIHSFFSFLTVEDPQYMEQAQKVLSISMKKTDQPPLMYLPLDTVKGLLDQPDRTTTQGKRDAVLLSLLYDTGARVQELADLKVGNVALNDTVTVTLTGKGGKSRIVPVMRPTGELMRQYIAGAGLSAPACNGNPLFINRSNKPLTRAGITYISKKYAEDAQSDGIKDISSEITPHWLRNPNRNKIQTFQRECWKYEGFP